MLTLRDYQRAAVDGLYDYWREQPGSPLIVLSTGGGKSLVLGTICKELIEDWPDMRVLVVTHGLRQRRRMHCAIRHRTSQLRTSP